jgi:hypothetical protein
MNASPTSADQMNGQTTGTTGAASSYQQAGERG